MRQFLTRKLVSPLRSTKHAAGTGCVAATFAMVELSDQKVGAPGSVACHSIPVRRFPIFCSLHHLFESSTAFEQRAFERGLERLFGAGIVERHLVLTHRLHQPDN